MPIPSSSIFNTTLACSCSSATVTEPPGGVYFERVGQQVHDHLLHPVRVGIDPRRHQMYGEVVALEPSGGGEGVDRASDDVGQIDGLPIDQDLARHHPTGIEEIVDQPGHVTDLPVDHFDREPTRHPGHAGARASAPRSRSPRAASVARERASPETHLSRDWRLRRPYAPCAPDRSAAPARRRAPRGRSTRSRAAPACGVTSRSRSPSGCQRR